MKDHCYAPTQNAKQFHCIRCGVYAHQQWNMVLGFNEGSWEATGITSSDCDHCGERCFWYEGKMIIPPASAGELPHPDLPADCRADFDEARDVYGRSPRAAAALLRLCIQKLMPDLGESGENINADIKSLVAKGLPVRVQQALDFCRVVGNNAVHPGELNLEDTPEIAQNLFRMINVIVEDRITRPAEIEALYLKLPETARTAIELRDQPINSENASS